jgi:hypothetical protein
LNTTGHDNIFIGPWTGYSNTTGNENAYIGRDAGFSNTQTDGLVFVGFGAGRSNTSGNLNTFLGYAAGEANTIGFANVFLGRGAGNKNTSGEYNVYVGNWAGGYSSTTGVYNVMLGGYSGYQATGSYNGYYETGSNKLYIDNIGNTIPLVYGDFSANYLVFKGQVGINGTKTAPTHLLDVGTGGAYCNGTTWVNGSSRELKENIVVLTTEEALAAFQELEPVKFNYKADKEEKYLGFIAEDVPELVAMKDRKGLSPMDVVAVLTKVVQEQQKTISELKERVGKLERKGKAEK